MRTARRVLQIITAVLCLCGSAAFLVAQDKVTKKDSPGTPNKESAATAKKDEPKLPEPFAPPPKLPRLAKDFDIWLDSERKVVIVDGKVVLREGQLEMFACPKQTKEHESIVAVNCKAQFVHAGLLALGAEPGTPVQFDPKYQPASGPTVEVTVIWKDDKGEHKVRAQEWIQQTKTGKPLEYPFVFAGSGFHVDEVSGVKYYLADGGDFICVSNFTSAMLDLPVPSSQQNNSLNFRAFTERIPPIGTPVRLELAPKLMDKKEAKKDSVKSGSTERPTSAEKPKDSKK